MLRTLELFGFEWDDEVVRQSERTERYSAALEELRSRGLTFECSCSRSQLADEERYPGHCRANPLRPGCATATRLRIDPFAVEFRDRIQGGFRQDVAAAVGDIVIRRRDRLFAYVLAVVVDDAAQGVTHVVRGADLLDNTPRQIYLQKLLRADHPAYAHVPVLTEPDGRKLAKSSRSVHFSVGSGTGTGAGASKGAGTANRPRSGAGGSSTPSGAVILQLIQLLELLALAPPRELADASIPEAWAWAMAAWNIDRVPKGLVLALER